MSGELRDGRGGDGVDHLGAVLDDAVLLVFGADDIAGGVLKIDQRRARLSCRVG